MTGSAKSQLLQDITGLVCEPETAEGRDDDVHSWRFPVLEQGKLVRLHDLETHVRTVNKAIYRITGEAMKADLERRGIQLSSYGAFLDHVAENLDGPLTVQGWRINDRLYIATALLVPADLGANPDFVAFLRDHYTARALVEFLHNAPVCPEMLDVMKKPWTDQDMERAVCVAATRLGFLIPSDPSPGAATP
ncbi:MAG: hypothetical protein M3O22_03615 [Pseudomonadota bacterium]|nr:hypothetical protein [Pseudomonadota bacterium]